MRPKENEASASHTAARAGTAGKTRWERMQKTALQLVQLGELLARDKAASGKSAQTLAWYEGSIRRYAEWLERQELEPTLRNFTVELVRRYILELQERPANAFHPRVPTQDRGLADSSINCYVRVLRAFSNWLYGEGYTQQAVLARLKVPRVTKKLQVILTAEEIADIVVSLNPRTEIGARDQAIFLLLLDTGMRAGELCGLRMGDLHLDEGYAMVLGKGRKQRPVKIGARAAKAVRFYVLHWRKPAVPHIEQVFLSCRGVTNEADMLAPAAGEPLTVNALGRIFRRIGRANEVVRLHPHLLRHTFACMHLIRYRDPFALKSLLGHTTLTMTNHYCEAVQQMEVVRADTVSIVDGIDLGGLNVNRRGRLAQHARSIR
jgi:site-specific recombinase XerD